MKSIKARLEALEIVAAARRCKGCSAALQEAHDVALAEYLEAVNAIDPGSSDAGALAQRADEAEATLRAIQARMPPDDEDTIAAAHRLAERLAALAGNEV